MNLQSIQILSIFIAISYSRYSPSSSRLLSRRENLERLARCGRGYADTDEKKWFWVAMSSDLTMFANRISKRHFITFSSLLVARNDQWMNTEEKIQRACDDGINLRVPPNQLSHLKIMTSDCFSVNPKDHTKCRRAVPVNAWIPHFCETGPADRTPMIIEVADDLTERSGVMCIANSNVPSLQRFGWAQMYILRQEDGLKKWSVQINSISQESYYINNNDVFTDNSEYSGLLVHEFNGKKYLIGYRDSRSEDPLQFHRISWFSDEICKLTGICGQEKKVVEAAVETTKTTRLWVPSSTELVELRVTETTYGYPEDSNTSTVPSKPSFSISLETTAARVPSTSGAAGPEATETTPVDSEDPVTSTVPSGPPTPEPKTTVFLLTTTPKPITTVPMTTVPPSTSTPEPAKPENIETSTELSENPSTVPSNPRTTSLVPKTTVVPVRITVHPIIPSTVATTAITTPSTRTKSTVPKRTRKPIIPYPEEPLYDYEEYEKIPFEVEEDMDYFGIWTQINGENKRSLVGGLILLFVLGFVE